MSGIVRRIRSLLFPPRCAACGVLLDWYEAGSVSEALCHRCRQKWDEATQDTCNACGKRVVSCRCITEELSRAKVQSLGKLVYYRAKSSEAVQNRVIFRMKKRRDRRTDDWLASQLQGHLVEMFAEGDRQNVVLTYAPRSKRAIDESGTDQAKDLAKALSRAADVPLIHALRRSHGVASEQKRLSADERIKQAKENFLPRKSAANAIRGRRVVLVDDIVTTGATAGACARILRRMGALEVHCLAAATDDTNQSAVVIPEKKSKSKK